MGRIRGMMREMRLASEDWRERERERESERERERERNWRLKNTVYI